jgi:hypothetical protein
LRWNSVRSRQCRLDKCWFIYICLGDRCGTVVKALCCKSEGCGFDSRWCHWNFSLT